MQAVSTYIRRARHCALPLVATLTITGCAVPQEPTPTATSPAKGYTLEVSGFTTRSIRRATNKTLLVTVPKAATGFETQRMPYTKDLTTLAYFPDGQWADAPAKMLQPILVRAFEGTGAFKAVVAPPAPALANYRVDVDIIRLQHELATTPSRIRFTARAKVVDMRNGQVIATQVFESVDVAPSRDASGTAQGANVAVQRVIEQVLTFTVRTLGLG